MEGHFPKQFSSSSPACKLLVILKTLNSWFTSSPAHSIQPDNGKQKYGLLSVKEVQCGEKRGIRGEGELEGAGRIVAGMERL